MTSIESPARRGVLSAAVGLGAVAAMLPQTSAAQSNERQASAGLGSSNTNVMTSDGVSLYVKDWGPKDGPVVTLSHGWPLNADSWESQALFLAENGFRVVFESGSGQFLRILLGLPRVNERPSHQSSSAPHSSIPVAVPSPIDSRISVPAVIRYMATVHFCPRHKCSQKLVTLTYRYVLKQFCRKAV